MDSLIGPVWDGYLADPFVLHGGDGAYYAFGTGGRSADGRLFPVLRSLDLRNWEFIGGALEPLEDKSLGNQFWAPEVARGDDGLYYLYYSVGPPGEAYHQLRVAISPTPGGPYRDNGEPPLVDPAYAAFTIDAHPFRDRDGQWYLFYARDFLDSDGITRAGTALVADRMVSMTKLAGEEVTILRPHYDWQRFKKDRVMPAYGGRIFDWHTLEGAFVVPHGGRYWCLYSGSAYGTPGYGVDYAVADGPLGPYSDAGSQDGPRLLKTISGHLHGPGHNSIITGPDGREYIAFHAWNVEGTKRQMYLCPIAWTKDGPHTVGLY